MIFELEMMVLFVELMDNLRALSSMPFIAMYSALRIRLRGIVLARDPPSRHLGRVIGYLDGYFGG